MFESANRHSIFVLIFRRRCYLGPITSDYFKVGHCYYEVDPADPCPPVMLCRKSLLFGKQLVPYDGLFKFPISCSSEEVCRGFWFDCTEQVKRSEAMRNCDTCPLVPLRKEHIGTVIAFPVGEKMSDPHFLYAYDNSMAFLMKLDGTNIVYNVLLKECYPLQEIYKDIAERAVSSDPLRSSIFDSFFKWLRGTDQYNSFASMVYGASSSAETQEAMIRLFELMSFEGITADTFEAEVDKRYNSLPDSSKDFDSRYEAVLATYESPARKYSRVEKEVMRATGFQYKTPQEAWEAEGGGKPFPENVAQVVLEAPSTPSQYICDKVGLYDGNAMGFWFSSICPALEEFPDFDTGYKDAVTKYLELYPELDKSQLSFIKEDDKEAVFKRILMVKELDKDDPFRAWTKNPPEAFKAYRREHPQMSYVEIFKEVYSLKKEA